MLIPQKLKVVTGRSGSWKNEVEIELLCLEEARGPCLEPGLEGGPVSERLVARVATEPGRAQPAEATWPLLHPTGPSSTVRTTGKCLPDLNLNGLLLLKSGLLC